MTDPTTLPAALDELLRRDGARPFLTFYDESTGERAELSVATTANWVAKTANFVQDSLGGDDTTGLSISLPVHWSTVVWLLAGWSAGCIVSPEADGAAADIAVVGPDAAATGRHEADEVVALSLRPLGGRFTEPLPAGITDYNAEVLAHDDRFVPWRTPTPASPALVEGQRRWTQRELLTRGRQQADEWGVAAGARMLLAPDAAVSLTEAVLVALVRDGSLVLVTDSRGAAVDPTRLDRLAEAERVTDRLA